MSSSWVFPIPGAHNWFPFSLLFGAGIPVRHGERSVIGSGLLLDPTANDPRGGGGGGSGDPEDPEDPEEKEEPEDPEAGG